MCARFMLGGLEADLKAAQAEAERLRILNVRPALVPKTRSGALPFLVCFVASIACFEKPPNTPYFCDRLLAQAELEAQVSAAREKSKSVSVTAL